MELSFCRRCGARLEHVIDNAYVCENKHPIYLNSLPTVGIFLVDDQHNVLLARRGIEPHKGMLDSIGGFVDGEETFEHAAIRELEEETGIVNVDTDELHYLTSAVGHYPFEGEVLSVVTIYFWLRVKDGVSFTASDDVASLEWFKLNEIDHSELHDIDTRAGVTALQKTLG